jgi:hypothetical protein
MAAQERRLRLRHLVCPRAEDFAGDEDGPLAGRKELESCHERQANGFAGDRDV